MRKKHKYNPCAFNEPLAAARFGDLINSASFDLHFYDASSQLHYFNTFVKHARISASPRRLQRLRMLHI